MAEVPITIYPTGYSLDAGELARYGVTHRYTSMSAFEAGEDVDWVSATDNPLLEVIGGDGSTNWGTVGADTTTTSFTSWTLSTTYYLKMTTLGTARPDFLSSEDTTAYRVKVADNRGIYFGNASALYVHMEWFQIIGTGTTGNRPSLQFAGAGGSIFDIKNCLISNEGTASPAFQLNTTASITGRFWNSIIIGGTDCMRMSDDAALIYHCTIGGGSSNGIETDNSDVTVINTAVFNNPDDYLDTFTSIDYNANDDGDGTNTVALNENASGEWAAAWTDYTSDDYRVKDASSLLYDAGTNLTGGNAPFTDLTGDTDPLANDILGNARTTDDIGAFVLVGAPAGTPMAVLFYHQNQMRH